MNRLQKIEQRAKAATPGPWKWEWEKDCDEWVDLLATADPNVIGGAILWARDGEDYQVKLQITEEDRTFIAHSRADIGYLLSHITTLENTIQSLKTQLQQAQDKTGSLEEH